MAVVVPSVSAVNRAGNVLRTLTVTANLGAITAPDELGIEQVFEALDTLEAWRAAHARPLGAATMGLRSRVSTMGCSQIEGFAAAEAYSDDHRQACTASRE